MCVTSHEQEFSSIDEFTETTRRRERGLDGELRQKRWMPEFNHWVLMLPPANADVLQPQFSEELAFWQRVKEAPGRALMLDVKRALLVAQVARTAAADVEAKAVTAEVTAASAEADRAAAEERTRSLTVTPVVRLFFMLSAMGGVTTRLPLLLPLAVMVMMWMPRI
ncbi:unnamed protein product [Ectocarpus sp. CCAP 1310/34]|nr:unnamed protein product [Ectocarpus sp. CCAP 1310/34]